MNDFYYMDVSLELANNSLEVSPVFFKNHVINSLTEVFGEVSSSINIDILKYDISTRRAIIRIPSSSYVKLRSALSLCGKYESVDCAYYIHNASPSLLSLTGNSRTYIH